ncbi:hypothetical protein HHK36_022546 [Tetracentron sinense]|uniref:Fungal lipase-like domain-containing protein n=1 Tax=Tetracentron sinense TaxID=13715 RepID=A0A834YN46_TETSI|nr:hypothetical protein HHK36_022546 [Tetracentron sinense]
MKVRLNVFTTPEQQSKGEDCFLVDMLYKIVEDAPPYVLIDNPLEASLAHLKPPDPIIEKSVWNGTYLFDLIHRKCFPLEKHKLFCRLITFGTYKEESKKEIQKGVMATEKEYFGLSGPSNLTNVYWNFESHQRSVAASLVQGVYILERDRQQNRQGPQALAPPWFQFFHFQLYRPLVDDADSSIIGAIFVFNPSPYNWRYHSTQDAPRYVIAFRGTIMKPDTLLQDFISNIRVIINRLHRSSRFETGIQAAQNMVSEFGNSNNIWLAGHSLGSAMAMLVGKNMVAQMGIFLIAFLFNPPFISVPIEGFKNEHLKDGLRIANSVATAGITRFVKSKEERSQSEYQFAALSPWIPHLYVNKEDHICCEYIGYFENREKMEKIGARNIGRVATQNSISCILSSAIRKKESAEPLHLLPSAYLTVALSPSPDFRKAHGIEQWWSMDTHLQSKLYQY